MAGSGLGVIVYIIIFIGEFFVSSGISIELVVGVLVTVTILLLTSLLVTCLITWKRKTDKLTSLLHFRSRSAALVRNNINARNTPALKETRKIQKKKNLSKSTTNLNNSLSLNETKKKSMSKSASCSALDLPLPSKPAGNKRGNDESNKKRITTIYDDDFQASIMLEENAAYDNNLLTSVSVSAMVDKINKGPEEEEGHEYEQLEMASIKDRT